MSVNNQQREKLHKSIWSIADSLRGQVDGWDFKQYVLGIMFYRFISENLAYYIKRNEPDEDFDYATMRDEDALPAKDGLVQEKGFFILLSQLFCNVRARARNDENLNETLEAVFKAIEQSANGTPSEGNFSGLFDDVDVNSKKLGATVALRNRKLCEVLEKIGDLDLGSFSENKIDVFGDAYEFLMTMYASGAGKSGGEFFTPQEVSELLTRIAIYGKAQVNKVYDIIFTDLI